MAIYGDSLSMPRSFDGVCCDQIYAELLRNDPTVFGENFHGVVFNRSQGGGRIKELYESFRRDLSYISDDKDKILIIQSGIVDCAPRPIPLGLRKVIGKLPVRIRSKIGEFLHQNRCWLQKIFRFRFTSKTQFRRVLKQWLATAGPMFKKIYVINIFPTTKEIDRHSPGLCESIEMFNKIIREQVERSGVKNAVLIDVFGSIAFSKEPVERFVSPKDGHHLTCDGHKLVKRLVAGHL